MFILSVLSNWNSFAISAQGTTCNIILQSDPRWPKSITKLGGVSLSGMNHLRLRFWGMFTSKLPLNFLLWIIHQCCGMLWYIRGPSPIAVSWTTSEDIWYQMETLTSLNRYVKCIWVAKNHDVHERIKCPTNEKPLDVYMVHGVFSLRMIPSSFIQFFLHDFSPWKNTINWLVTTPAANGKDTPREFLTFSVFLNLFFL